MPDRPAKCETCGRELGSVNGSSAPPSILPFDAKREEWDRRLTHYVAALEGLAGQVAELRESVRSGDAGSQQVLEMLEAVSRQLQPRHGLCVRPECVLCRAQEQAIKDHVLLYVDWKVPGTVEKLEQARRAN